jgi:hypothetical protein
MRLPDGLDACHHRHKAPNRLSLLQDVARDQTPALMMCVRFPLWPLNVEDLVHERGIDITH